ncbi:MAG: flagellar basal body P-ring protein FlgI [Planctomycetaceae bacterium]|nr:flagellar basal body P-ring protein FlgI [Planctomycetaceae bacterium]
MFSHSTSLRSLMCCLIFAGLVGCQEMNIFRSQNPDEEKAEDSLSRVLREEQQAGRRSLVKEYTAISGNKMTILEGVGLVTKLDATGGDSPSTQHRKALLDEMRRRQIDNPNQILRSPYTAMVVVRAFLPALVDKGEHIDVEVRLPDGSEATSLAGGWLMRCDLVEQAIVEGRGVMSGKRLAYAEGPILVAAHARDEEANSSSLMRGVIPAGGVCLRESKPLTIHLRNDYRSVRMANRITKRIGERFHDYDEYGIRRPLAKFEADSRIDLEVHPRYKENDARYLEVVGNIAFNETKVERQLRIQRLRDELMQGPTAARAALQLEAIGRDASSVLKEGLTAPTLEARFHSAVALAYMGVDDGVPVLAEAADKERAFRVFAFAAMAALDGGEAYSPLIALLDHPSTETRYGAFRTLTTLNPNDPAIRGEDMNDQFIMHVLPTQAAPLIHLTRRQKTELVLFGDDQKFASPLAINAGKHIWVTSQVGQDHVVVSRYEPGKEDRRVEVSPEIAEVIRTVVDLGGTYPDIVQMLVQAEDQHNLPGTIAIDALPQAGRRYSRPAADQLASRNSARVGHQNMTPNIFPQTGDAELPDQGELNDAETDEDDNPEEDSLSEEASASLIPASAETGDSAESDGRSLKKSFLSAVSAYDE